MSVLGIDLGTLRVKTFGIGADGRAVPVDLGSTNTMPSVVYYQDGSPLFGAEAQNMALVDPKNGVFHWKRHVGTQEVLHVKSSGEKVYAMDIACLFLQHVKSVAEAQFGMIIDSCVICTPANFDNGQKAEFKQAAVDAGFTFAHFAACGKPQEAMLLHEPTAALLAKIAASEKESQVDGLRLCVDVGGGTTDITLCNKAGNKYDVLASNGVPKLGGLDYTEVLVDHCFKELERVTGAVLDKEKHMEDYLAVREKVEEAKARLAKADRYNVFVSIEGNRTNVVLTRDTVRDLTRHLTDQVLACVTSTLEEARQTHPDGSLENIKELFPIGGGTQLFCILEELERFFGRPLNNVGDPHLAVAKGAAFYGWTESGKVQTPEGLWLPAKDMVVADRTSHAIGVAALDQTQQEVFTTILDKGARMPGTQVKTFCLVEDGQTDAQVKVFQGEQGASLADCLCLGEFSLNDLTPVYDTVHKIEVELRIDKNGLLTATAYDPLDGKSAELQLTYERSGERSAA